MIARRVIIHGRVQGVFYRDWTVEAARLRGITGWVRNQHDGTVVAHLEGAPSAVEALIDEMHSGPPRARVERVEQREAESEGLASFERR